MRRTFVATCILALVLAMAAGIGQVLAKKPVKSPEDEVPWGVDRIDADEVWDMNTGADKHCRALP